MNLRVAGGDKRAGFADVLGLIGRLPLVSGLSSIYLAGTRDIVRQLRHEQGEAAQTAATGRHVNSLHDDAAAINRFEILDGQAALRRTGVSELLGLVPEFRNAADALSQARQALVQAQGLADNNPTAQPAQIIQYNDLVAQISNAVGLAIESGFSQGTDNIVSAAASVTIAVVSLPTNPALALDIVGSELDVASVDALASTATDLTVGAADRAALLASIDVGIVRIDGFAARLTSIATLLEGQAGALEGASQDLLAADPIAASLRVEQLRVQLEVADGVFGVLSRTSLLGSS